MPVVLMELFTKVTIEHSETYVFFFFFKDTATTEISPLPLHDALPIWAPQLPRRRPEPRRRRAGCATLGGPARHRRRPRGPAAGRRRRALRRHPGLHAGGSARLDYRSEEHTSELQSQSNLVCRLLLEKK